LQFPVQSGLRVAGPRNFYRKAFKSVKRIAAERSNGLGTRKDFLHACRSAKQPAASAGVAASDLSTADAASADAGRLVRRLQRPHHRAVPPAGGGPLLAHALPQVPPLQHPLSDLGSSCYTKGGMILCRTDYIRLFGSHGTCAGCSMHISATEFVLRSSASSEGGGGGSSRVYHVQCFVCSQCRCQLQPGDRYALLPSGLPVCESDFAKAFAAAAATGTAASAASGGVGSGGGSQTAAAAAPATSKRGGGGKKKGGGGGQKQQPPLQPVC
ncbi:hypothetical protein BOX15_Mlig001522g1, partial [Macrostomum lignano]